MFTKRHEQELAEIKAMVHQLEQRFEAILEQLDGIKQNQDQLTAGHTAGHTSSGGQKRKSERGRAKAPEADSPRSGGAGAKKRRARKQRRSQAAGRAASTEG
jgi:hypothetical protein